MNESSDSFEVNPNNSAAGSTGSSSGDTPPANNNNTNNTTNTNSVTFDVESQAEPIVNREVVPSISPFDSMNDDEEGHPAPAAATAATAAADQQSSPPWSALNAASKFMSLRPGTAESTPKADGNDSDDEDYISSSSEDDSTDDEGLSLDATTVNTRDINNTIINNTNNNNDTNNDPISKAIAANRGKNKTIIINSRFDTTTNNSADNGNGGEDDKDAAKNNKDTTKTNNNDGEEQEVFDPNNPNANEDNSNSPTTNNTNTAPTFTTYSAIRSIVYSPSGKTITVGGDRKKVTTFSPSTSYSVVKEHKIHKGAVLSMCYSPDGRYLYVGGDDEKVSVFACESSYFGGMGKFGSGSSGSAYHYNNRLSALSNINQNRRSRGSSALGQSYITASTTSGAGGFRDSLMSRGSGIVGNNDDGDDNIRDSITLPGGSGNNNNINNNNNSKDANGAPFFPYPNPQPTPRTGDNDRLYQYEINQDVEAIAHSPKGNYIAVGGSDKKVLIYNTTTKELEREFDVGGWILDIKYSPDGKKLAVAGYDAVGVSEFDLTDHEKVTYYEDIVGEDDNHLTKGEEGDDENGENFDDDGANFNGNGNFNVNNGPKVVHADEEIGKTPSQKTSGIVRSIAYSPDGKYLVIGGSNKKVIVYNTMNHEVVATHSRSSEVNAISYSPDGSFIAVGGDGGKVTIYNADSKAIAEAAEMANSSLASERGGRGENGKEMSEKQKEKARKRKKKKKKNQVKKEPHTVQKDFETEHAVFAIDISPDSNFVSVGGYSDRVTVFNISIPTMLKEFDMNGDVITKIDSEAYRQEIYARNRIDPKKEALNALGMAGILSAALGFLILIIYLLE